MAQKKDKVTLVISRYWDHPQITVRVNDERIAIEIPVDEFLKGLVQETANPATLLTRSRLEKELLKSMETVLEKVKEASASAV